MIKSQKCVNVVSSCINSEAAVLLLPCASQEILRCCSQRSSEACSSFSNALKMCWLSLSLEKHRKWKKHSLCKLVSTTLYIDSTLTTCSFYPLTDWHSYMHLHSPPVTYAYLPLLKLYTSSYRPKSWVLFDLLKQVPIDPAVPMLLIRPPWWFFISISTLLAAFQLIPTSFSPASMDHSDAALSLLLLQGIEYMNYSLQQLCSLIYFDHLDVQKLNSIMSNVFLSFHGQYK